MATVWESLICSLNQVQAALNAAKPGFLWGLNKFVNLCGEATLPVAVSYENVVAVLDDPP